MSSQYFNDSIFWIEVEKIHPNPYQPRKDFDQLALKSLSDSIRQYGVLQALVVTRKDVEKPDGGMSVEYELIAGERRLRASKLAGLTQVPCLIQTGIEDNSQLKLELAIIENLQREDLNPVDRAKSFKQLSDEFGMTHAKIAEKVGKSREYVSNSMRLLQLPEEIMQAVVDGKITEGHARSLLMLSDKPAEQATLFKEIIFKRLTVRETEQISRKVAHKKARKKDAGVDPAIIEMEERFSESLGTRVHIEKKKSGGKILIDFFSDEDLQTILDALKSDETKDKAALMNRFIANGGPEKNKEPEDKAPTVNEVIEETTGITFEDQSDVPEPENEVRPGYYQHEDPGSEPKEPHIHDASDETYGGSSELGVPSYGMDKPTGETTPQRIVENIDTRKKDESDDDVFSMDKFTI